MNGRNRWARFVGWVEHITSGNHIPAAVHPQYGHGRFGRPLWTKRDRDAEEIRKVLRRAGLREFTDRHVGFAVEGDGRPFDVMIPDGQREIGSAALRAAGYRVAVDPTDNKSLHVTRGIGNSF